MPLKASVHHFKPSLMARCSRVRCHSAKSPYCSSGAGSSAARPVTSAV